MIRTIRQLAAVCVAAVPCAAGGQTCEPVWDASFGPADMRTMVAVTAFDDDGSGLPSLYVGGNFEALSGRIHPNFIARLDGHQWTPVGRGVDAGVGRLTVFDEDGAGPQPPALFVTGGFTEAGGQPVERIARWDGATWSPMDVEFNGSVSTTLVGDLGGVEALYLAGGFTEVNETPGRIARWDGTSMTVLGEGLDGIIRTLAIHDEGGGPALYVGGYRSVPLSSALQPFVARWDGAQWHEHGDFAPGPQSMVRALVSFDSDGSGPEPAELIAGGKFHYVDGAEIKNIAAWRGGTWAPLEGGLDGDVYTMQIFDEDGDGPLPARLFIGGQFNRAFFASGGSTSEIQRLVRWDGETWSRVGQALHGDRIWGMCVFDPDGSGPEPEQLVIVGSISFAGVRESQTIAAWDGQRWRFPGGGFDSGVNALASGPVAGASPDAIYAAGQFRVAGDGFADYLARFDEDGWAPVGPAPDDVVHAVHATDPDGAGPLPPSLFIGGEFLKVGFVNAPRIARWDGQYWWPMGVGANGIVRAFATFDEDGAGPGQPNLFVGGEFSSIGNASTRALARWDGVEFHPMAEPLVSTLSAPKVRAMIVHDDGRGEALMVAGHFTGAGDVESRGVIRWDGTEWSSLGDGIGLSRGNHEVLALAVHDDGRGPALYAGGVFTFESAAGETIHNVARWDGASWAPLGAGILHTVYSVRVNALASADLGGRQVLVAGGSFNQAGSAAADDLAIWDGAAWSALEPGIDDDVLALLTAPDGNGVLVGGRFRQTGAIASGRFARLLSCDAPCYADCDGSGALDIFDFLCFQNAYVAGDPYADCDGSGEIDFFDFLCFQNAFSAGCP